MMNTVKKGLQKNFIEIFQMIFNTEAKIFYVPLRNLISLNNEKIFNQHLNNILKIQSSNKNRRNIYKEKNLFQNIKENIKKI